jgi:hypothetical protein
MEMVGGGVGDYSLGRKSYGESVVVSWLIFIAGSYP